MELLDQFKQYLLSQKNGASKATVKNYLSDLRKFFRWFENSFSKTFEPSDLTADVITLFAKSRGETMAFDTSGTSDTFDTSRSSPRSFERYLSSLRKFAQFLKEEKLIESNPFDQIINNQQSIINKSDPWHIHDFKDYLYVFGASNLTIKNYVVDIKAFANWVEQALGIDQNVSENNIAFLTPELIEEYKERLINVLSLSPKTVNRKLSSIRKYLEFATAQGLIKNDEFRIMSYESGEKEKKAGEGLNLDDLKEKENNLQSTINNQYSKLPPLRLLQRLFVPYLLLEDFVASRVANFIHRSHLASKARFTQIKTGFSQIRGNQFLNPRISNIPKEMYAPHEISLEGFSWHQKLIHHAKYTRPKWYKKYHTYSFVHYFHFAILVIYASAVGFIIYTALFAEPEGKLALAAPTAPPRILSFQGRLTDQSDNPITTATDIRFQIYDDLTATGSGNLLWQEVIELTPDQDGIFSELLGNGSTCAGQPLTVQQTRCAIPASVFTDNASLYLGITIEATPELTPRQRLATVAYAANAESLQGMLPITDAAVTDNVNTVLVLDSSGNLTMDGATAPTFQATGGQFKISGQPLLLTTNTGTNNNVIIDPDGLGKVDLRKPLVNTTATGDISPGGVTINDKVGVLATESAVAAFVVNNNTTGGDIIAASSSGTTRMTLSNAGVLSLVGGQTADITSLGNANLTLSAGGTGDLRILSDSDTDIIFPGSAFTVNNSVLYTTTSTGVLTRATTDSSNLCLVSGASAPTWSSCATAAGDDWTVASGAIFPNLASTLDFLLGSTATASAEFAVTGINDGTPTATISATTGGGSGNGISLTAATATIQSLRMNTLNIGGSTTGNIVIDSGSNAITISDATTFSGLATFNAGATVASGQNLTLAGITGNNASLYATAGTGVVTSATTSTANLCLVSGASAPAWATCASGQSNDVLWSQSSGLLYPNNSTVDLTIGGQSTASAKFAVINVNSGNPTATISGNLSLVVPTTAGANTFNLLNNSTLNFQRSPGGDAGLTTALFIQNNGNVGIGTTGPLSQLHVRNSGDSKIRIQSGGTSDAGIEFAIIGGSDVVKNAIIFDSSNSWYRGDIHFVLNNVVSNDNYAVGTDTKMIIKYDSGNVGIGTTSPTALLDVAGAASVSSSLTFRTGAGSIQSTAMNTLTLGGSTTGNIVIDSGSSSITLSDATTASSSFTVSGTLIANGLLDANGQIDLGDGGDTFSLDSTALDVSTLGVISGTTGLSSSGTITFSAFNANNNVLYATVTTGVLAGANTSTQNLCLVSGASAPTWATCASGQSNDVLWSQSSGLLYPNNSTVNLAIGGQSTASAKFAVLNINSGTPVASVAGTLSLGSAAGTTRTIGATAMNALQLGDASTGDLVFAPANSAAMTIKNGGNVGIGTTNPSTNLHVYSSSTAGIQAEGVGTGNNFGNFRAVNNQSSSIYLLTYGSGWTENLFGTSRAGYSAVVSDGANSNGIMFGTTTADPIIIGTNNAENIRIASGGNVGIGTTSPTALLDVAGAASVSSSLTFRTGAGSIQTTAMNTLTLGGSTTGNIVIDSGSSSISLSDATSITGNLTVSTLNTAGGVVYGSNTSGLLAVSAAGSTSQCLLSGGSGAPTWGSCATGVTNDPFWQQTSGALLPNNSTVDLLIGAQATGSAKFSVLNINSGTPTASVSANSGNNATYLTGNGTLATTNRQTLTIGNSSTYNTTGNVLINPNGTGNVGIGTTSPNAKLDVSGRLLAGNTTSAALDTETTNYVTNPSFETNLTGWSTSGPVTGSQDNTKAAVGTYSGKFVATGGGVNWWTVSNTITGLSASTTYTFSWYGEANVSWQFRSQPSNTWLTSSNIGSNIKIRNSVNLTVQAGDNSIQAYINDNATDTIWIDGIQLEQGSSNMTNYCDGDQIGCFWTGTAHGSSSKRFAVGTTGFAFGSELWGKNSSNSILYRFDSSGNAGIGTVNPVGALEVNKQQVGKALVIFNQTGTDQNILVASASGTTKLVLTNAGNLGIGNTTPLTALDVTGSATLSASLSLRGAGTAHTFNILDNGTLNIQRSPGGDTGLATALFIQNNGNVGIGTTGPTQQLTIRNMGTGTNDPTIAFNRGDITGWHIGVDASDADKMKIGTSQFVGTEDMVTIQTNGNVGIGTTGPDRSLDVLHASSPQLRLTQADGTVYTDFQMDSNGDLIMAVDGQSNQLVLDNGGNVGIGTTSPLEKLDVSGNATASGNLTLYGAARNIQTTSLNTLTLGGSTTGNVFVQPNADTDDYFRFISDGTNLTFDTVGSPNLTIGGTGTANINIGTDATARTITIGNNTTTTALAFTSGTGSQTFTSNVATGTTTTSGFVLDATAISSGTGLYLTTDSITTGRLIDIATSGNTLTSGRLLNLASTATSLIGTAGIGSLLNLDWSPGSATTATGDLFSLNIGANGTTTGSLFNILDSSSSIFSVSETAFTTSLPSSFTSAGDVSLAYDLLFTNPTASYIKSTAPLYIQAGETFNSSDLTLRTFNKGNTIIDSEAFVTNYAATISGQLVVGTSTPTSTAIGAAYITNAATYGKALAILNQTESQDIFTASSSGTTKFTIDTSGNVTTVDNAWFGLGSAAGRIEFDDQTTDEVNILNANVGIGTATPQELLHTSTGAVTNAHYNTTDSNVIFEGGDSNLQILSNDGGNWASNLFLTSAPSSGDNKHWALSHRGSSQSDRFDLSYVTTAAGGDITSGTITNVLTALTGGNVGIGTTSPLSVLHVEGGNTGGRAALIVNQTGASSNDLLTASASGVTKLRVLNDGTIRAPAFYDIDNTAYFLDPAATAVSLQLAGDASTSGSLVFDGTNKSIDILNGSRLDFQTSPGGDAGLTARMTILNNGNVGIGTTAPTSELYVTRPLSLGATGKAITIFDQIESQDIISASAAGTTRFVVNNNGNIQAGLGQTALSTLTKTGTTARTFTLPDETGTVCLQNSSNCGFAIGTLYWDQNSGALYPKNSTVDLLVGGTSTASADFAVLNVNGTGPATATVSGNLIVMANNGDGGNVGIGTTAPGRKLDVVGTWGGNVATSNRTETSAQTITVSTAALAYHLTQNSGTTESSFTVTFNITGLPGTNGTFAFIKTRAQKGITSFARITTVDIQINGVQIGTVSTVLTANASTNDENYVVARTDGSWRVIGTSGNDSADIAEWIRFLGEIPTEGDVLIIGEEPVTVRKSQKPYDENLIGVVSTKPHTTMATHANDSVRLALTGRVPVKVTDANGPILIGDAITSSPLTGYGMRSSRAGRVVGKALEQFDPQNRACTSATSLDQIVWPEDDGTNPHKPCFRLPDGTYIGKIMSFVNVSWYDPYVYLTSTGDLSIVSSMSAQTSSTSGILNTYYLIHNTAGQLIRRVGAFVELAVANVRAGLINAQEITTNTLSVATDSVTIAGQTLEDYIISIIQNSEFRIQNGEIVSPLASIDQIHTNVISPLGKDSSIALKLENDKLAILNTKSSTPSAVTTIDSQGNVYTEGNISARSATLSGSLTADSLRTTDASISGNLASDTLTANEATVSGTLFADRIVANNIEGLEAKIASVAAQSISSNAVSSLQYSVSSESGQIDLIASILNTKYEILNTDFLDIRNLSADFGTFRDGLMALGPATFNQVTALESLSIGTTMMLGPNSIDTLGQDLEIQPLKQGAISFLAGAVRIETDGTLRVSGNAEFAGNVKVEGKLSANIISPLSDQDLIIHLGGGRTDSPDGGQIHNSEFRIQNSSASAVLLVNQQGDLVASGSGTFGKLNLSLAEPAHALSDTQAVATGSAGTAVLKRYRTEVTINNPLVTRDSLIYITPIGNISNQILHLLRQLPENPALSGVEGSFTVGVGAPATADIKFNWLIVN